MTTPASRYIAWMTWLIASIFYAYQYILRVMPNIMLGDIMQRFHFDTAIFGQFTGIYYIGYSLMHLPIGILLDRFGPRKVMTGCILLTVVGMLPLIMAEHWAYPILGRLLVGIGSSAAILGTFKIIRMTFSEQRFPRMLSFSVTIGLIGAIYGGAPVNAMFQSLGYEAVIKIFTGMGLGLALLTYYIVPEIDHTPQSNMMSDVKSVLTNKRVVLCCLFAGLMVGPLEGFADVWSAAFLKQVYGLNSQTSSSLPSLIFIGMAVGAPLLTLIADKTKSYLGTIVGAGLIMIVCFIALLTGWLNVSLMSLSFTLVGICCAYQILAIYKASTYVHEDVVGLCTALANMIIMSFGYAFHSLIGLIVHTMGGALNTDAFTFGIGIIPLTLSIGVIGFSSLLVSDKLKTSVNHQGKRI